MQRLLRGLATLASVIAVAMAAVACGDAEDDAPALTLQQADRDRLVQMATDYVHALEARDMTVAMAQLPAGVPESTVTKSMNTVRDEGFALESVGDVRVDGQNVVVTVHLSGKAGPATRSLEFKIDKGDWRLWSPQLKPAE